MPEKSSRVAQNAFWTDSTYHSSADPATHRLLRHKNQISYTQSDNDITCLCERVSRGWGRVKRTGVRRRPMTLRMRRSWVSGTNDKRWRLWHGNWNSSVGVYAMSSQFNLATGWFPSFEHEAKWSPSHRSTFGSIRICFVAQEELEPNLEPKRSYPVPEFTSNSNLWRQVITCERMKALPSSLSKYGGTSCSRSLRLFSSSSSFSRMSRSQSVYNGSALISQNIIFMH